MFIIRKGKIEIFSNIQWNKTDSLLIDDSTISEPGEETVSLSGGISIVYCYQLCDHVSQTLNTICQSLLLHHKWHGHTDTKIEGILQGLEHTNISQSYYSRPLHQSLDTETPTADLHYTEQSNIESLKINLRSAGAGVLLKIHFPIWLRIPRCLVNIWKKMDPTRKPALTKGLFWIASEL